jgi:hypothetical protein
MAGTEPRPTEPLRPDSQPTRVTGAGTGCRAGHEHSRNPTFHPTLGLVPAASSVVIGALLLLAVLLLERWLLPGLIVWTVGVAAVGLVVSAVVQLALGHRGTCFLRRTLRWWLGPIGSMIDPIEMG